MGWVRLHPYNIAQKVEVVVEHFRQYVAPLLDESFTAPLSNVVRDNPDATYDYLEFRGIAESSAA